MKWINQPFGKVLDDTNEPATSPDPQYLVWIKPGKFTMGSPTDEVYRLDSEGPQTRVTISKGFWMGKHEVTQGQYTAVTGGNPSVFKGSPNLPVEMVSWVDATSFCAKLTERERQEGRLPAAYVYRLPTEAEWEYACRAGTMTRFSFGDDPQSRELEKYAWYSGNSGCSTHPVGAKAPNAWGLYDMHGNLWEWCQDWYGGSLPGGCVIHPQEPASGSNRVCWYGGSLPGGSVIDPVGPASGSNRVIRGGRWNVAGANCRAALRIGVPPGVRHHTIGFRPVLAPGQ